MSLTFDVPFLADFDFLSFFFLFLDLDAFDFLSFLDFLSLPFFVDCEDDSRYFLSFFYFLSLVDVDTFLPEPDFDEEPFESLDFLSASEPESSSSEKFFFFNLSDFFFLD